jgi:steroid delta-isomerase-like uncharacterized protein
MNAAKLLIILSLLAPSAAIAATPEANEKVAARVFLEKMGQGRFDKLDEIYGPGFIAHDTNGGTYTLEEDNASGREWRKAAPDLTVTIERIVGAKDLVAVHFRGSGTNTVAAAGLPGTGRKMSVQGMTFFRFKDGRIVEEWSLIDIAGLMRQVGSSGP